MRAVPQRTSGPAVLTREWNSPVHSHAGANPEARVSRVNWRRASGSRREISEVVYDAHGRSGILAKPQQRPAIL
jgi:hypothetical protein